MSREARAAEVDGAAGDPERAMKSEERFRGYSATVIKDAQLRRVENDDAGNAVAAPERKPAKAPVAGDGDACHFGAGLSSSMRGQLSTRRSVAFSESRTAVKCNVSRDGRAICSGGLSLQWPTRSDRSAAQEKSDLGNSKDHPASDCEVSPL